MPIANAMISRAIKGAVIVAKLKGVSSKKISILPIIAYLSCLAMFDVGSAQAQSTSSGYLGWCAAYGPSDDLCRFYGSAEAACEADHRAFNPDAKYMGTSQTINWPVVHCNWCKYNGDGVGCYGIGAPNVVFMCQAGYKRVPPGNCIKEDQPNSPPPPACTAAGGQGSPATSRPVVILTGSKSYTHSDFSSFGQKLDLVRVFTNLRTEGAWYRPSDGFGINWLYDFQYQLALSQDTRINLYTLRLPNGFSADFWFTSATELEFTDKNFTSTGGRADNYKIRILTAPPTGDVDYFIKNKSRWEVKSPDGSVWVLESFSEDYSQSGDVNYSAAKPVSRRSPAGQTTTFTYTTQGELKSAQDDYGNKVEFLWNYQILYDPNNINSTYNKPLSIKSASLPDGSIITYSYDSTTASSQDTAERLNKMERRDAANQIIDSWTYIYGDSRWPLYITQVRDNRGITINSVEYDVDGRVTRSSGVGETDKSVIVYGDVQSDGTIKRTVTTALGKQSEYIYRRDGTRWRFESTNGIASANCPASVVSQSFDGNSFVTSEIDEEGRKTTYARDSMGRPTSITRGAP